MNEITLKAFAKINLALDVLRKREDGYHDVRMIMQNIRLFDKITMRRTGGKDCEGVTTEMFIWNVAEQRTRNAPIGEATPLSLRHIVSHSND